MNAVRVYADFNDYNETDMGLRYVGTLRDLSRQRVKLSQGMRLVLYDSGDGTEDMEVDAIARYRPPSAGTEGRWFAEIVPGTFRRVPRPQPPQEEHFDFPCFHCGVDIYDWLCQNGLTPTTLCPRCGGLVEEGVRPPDDRSTANA